MLYSSHLIRMVSQSLSLIKFFSKNKTIWSKSRSISNLVEAYVPLERCISKIDPKKVEEAPDFDDELINHLERLSLVRFTNEQAVAHLRAAIKYANQLKLLDTTGIEHLESILEDFECPLVGDIPSNTTTKEEVLMNAKVSYEGYFVSPPGNIPLEEETKLDLQKINE